MLLKRSLPQVAALLVLAVSSSCQFYHRHKALTSDAVIASPAIYESQDDKLLATEHLAAMRSIYAGTRDRFSAGTLEFFLISGLCFRKLQLKATYDTYLAVSTRSADVFSADESTFEKRASQIFTAYSKPLLAIAASEKTIMEDERVAGIMVSTRWNVRKELQQNYRFTTYEEMNLVVHKKEISGFLRGDLSDQQLLDQSTLIALGQGESPRIVQLLLE